MADVEKRRGGLIPFRIPLPNPLAWRPRFGSADRTEQQRKQAFASTSVAVSESMLAGSHSAATASAASAHCGTAASTAAMPSTTLAQATATVAPASRVPLKPASDVLAGALARAASQSTIHPLDTLKVRLQTRKAPAGAAAPPPSLSKFGQLVPPAPSSGAGAPGKAAMPGGGLRLGAGRSGATGAPGMQLNFDLKTVGATVGSLYRGVIGAASGAGIAIGAYFAVYGVACNALSQRTDLSPSAVAFVAGGIAAAGSSVVKVPLAVCIRSVQAGVYPNVFAAARRIVAAAGPRGLFTGFAPTLLEDVPDMAIKFAAYESLRQVHRRVYNGRPANVQEDFAMGAFSGALAAAATTPLDVIKTNMMCAAASRPTMASAARAVHAAGGAAGFFRGVGTRALSNGINSAVFFCFFEAIRVAIKERQQGQGQQQQRAITAQPATVAAVPRPVPAVRSVGGGTGAVVTTSVRIRPGKGGVKYLTQSDEEREFEI